MYPELVTRPDLDIFLPADRRNHRLHLRRAVRSRESARAADLPRARRVQRLRRVRLRHLHLPALPRARHRGVRPHRAGRRRRAHRLQSQGGSRPRRGDEVPRLQRPQAPGGRRQAATYFERTECVAGVQDARFQQLMPDVLHWLGITRIHRLVSMSNMKFDAIAGSGIQVDERVPIRPIACRRTLPSSSRPKSRGLLHRGGTERRRPRQGGGRDLEACDSAGGPCCHRRAPCRCVTQLLACSRPRRWRAGAFHARSRARGSARSLAGRCEPPAGRRRHRRGGDAGGLSRSRGAVPRALATFHARRRGSLGSGRGRGRAFATRSPARARRVRPRHRLGPARRRRRDGLALPQPRTVTRCRAPRASPSRASIFSRGRLLVRAR